MRKIILIFSLSIYAVGSCLAQEVPDISPTDCDGNTYNVHDMLDNGKIIVIGWAMPCFGCVAPLLDVHNSVLNFAVSNPGVVEYWLCDDFADIECSTFKSWCINNGMTYAKYFSSSDLSMDDYGSHGMPKVVVIGCSNKKVYYNRDNTATGAGVTASINEALAEIANNCVLGIEEATEVQNSGNVYPIPASKLLNVPMKDQNDVIGIAMYSISGEKRTIETWELTEQGLSINTDSFSKGIYTLTIQRESYTEVKKVIIDN